MRWAEHALRIGKRRRVHRILVAKRETKRQLVRRRRRWKYNIKMDLK